MSLLIPVDAFDRKFFKINFKNKLLVAIISSSEPKMENKRADT